MEPISASITANVLFYIKFIVALRVSIDNDFLSVKRISKAKYHPIKNLINCFEMPCWEYSLIRYVKNKLKQVTLSGSMKLMRLSILKSSQRDGFSWHCIIDSLVLSYAKKIGLISQKCI